MSSLASLWLCLFIPAYSPQLSPSFFWVLLSGEKAGGSGQPIQGADTTVVTLPQGGKPLSSPCFLPLPTKPRQKGQMGAKHFHCLKRTMV